MPDPGWWEALWPDPAKVLSDTGLASGMSVVDLCCGDGWFTLPIAQTAKEAIAIDIDTQLLKRAEVRLAERGMKNCTFIESDAYELGRVVTKPANYVFLANAFHGVPDRPRLAAAVRDILLPGGLFVIVNWHALPREATPILGEPRGPATELRISPETTLAAVETSGLVHRMTVPVSPYHYGAVFARPA